MVATPTSSSIEDIRARLGPRDANRRGHGGRRPGGDRILLVALAVLGIGVVAFSLIRGGDGPARSSGTVDVSHEAPGGAEAGEPAGADGDDPPASAAAGAEVPAKAIRVHVAGAVASPGVYTLASGAICDEAIAAAGGALVEADLGRVNLAGKLADGQQLYVPRVGEAVPDTATASGDSGAAGAEPGAAAPVNINTAGVAALDELPGIGASTAQKIVDYRTKHGPFADVRQLLDVPGIGEGKLAALEGLVTT
ncbi:MAG: ComEA family DNA-binding protein [Acidimicrobiia bacterium]|nr:ComEA family DNA-binding protein [Acidimicrobiia bacterium]